MKERAWKVNKVDEKTAVRLANAIGSTLLLARVLVARGMDTPEAAMQFLGEDTPISDPFLLKDMDKAVERIRRAVDEDERIVIFGDYDVDGVTATALLYDYLQNTLFGDIGYMLPSRSDDGYGLSERIVRQLAEEGCQLLITVDNGISAVNEVALANELGMDVVVTDHHLPGEQLPAAVAVVDPKRADDTSPFKALCGAGVAFKLCCALDDGEVDGCLEEYSDLTALGTVADKMPLLSENRTIVKEGLRMLTYCNRPGLAALIERCGLADRNVTADKIGYTLGPRINAAGRMANADVALDLLICEEPDQGEALADQLFEVNAERQQVEHDIMDDIHRMLDADPSRKEDRIMLVWGENFHPGVIGIVASKLVESYHKPAIVISLQNGEGRGSGRSVEGFNLYDALAACQGCLVRFGGHAMAAGLSVREEQLNDLRSALNEYAATRFPEFKTPPLMVDVEIRLDQITLDEVEGLHYLEPCGDGNPSPLFLAKNVVLEGVNPSRNGNHSYLNLRQDGGMLSAMLFNKTAEELMPLLGSHVDVVLDLSIYEGKLSAHVKGLRQAKADPGQVRLYAAFRKGQTISSAQKALLRPDRAYVAGIYRTICKGGVSADTLQPLLAQIGAQTTGKTMAGLEALLQLGLIEVQEQNGVRVFAQLPVSGKKDLTSAPILKALQE